MADDIHYSEAMMFTRLVAWIERLVAVLGATIGQRVAEAVAEAVARQLAETIPKSIEAGARGAVDEALHPLRRLGIRL